jgi:uncharacterized protein (DUF2141 family)
MAAIQLILRLLLSSLCAQVASVSAQAKLEPGPTPPPVQQASGTLSVELFGFKNDRGQALLALFRSKQGFPSEVRYAIWSKALPIHDHHVSVTIQHVPAGIVALAMVHDEDKDFAMDTGLFGIPTEGYGASRDASASFGPPKFDDAAFPLRTGERKSIRIAVRY